MTYRLRNIAIALALAVLAAMLTSFYVRQQKQDIQSKQQLATVYVATADIEPGTSGADVADMVETAQVTKGSVAPGAIVSLDRLNDRIATEKIYAGEQVTELRFRPQTQQGIRAKLSGTLRAVQVPGDAHQLLAGTLKEGDKVDVVANLTYNVVDLGGSGGSGGEENTATRVILRDILVLRGVQGAEEAALDEGATNSVLLAVTDAQAQKLFFAMQNGEWTFQLRPTADPADSPESVETIASILADGLKGEQLRQLTTLGPPKEEE